MDSNSTTYNPNGVGELPFTPILGASVAFTVIFAILLFASICNAIRFWRFYGHAIGMVCGLLLEFLGYVAKVQLAHNRHNKNGYIMYIIGLTLGPTFLSASLYLSIGALQRRYEAARFSHLKPALFSTLFIMGDFASLCFIGVGGSLAAIYAWSPIGVDLMIAGLATQVLFTSLFCVLLVAIYRKIRVILLEDKKYFVVIGQSVAAACLFIRSCWRVAELSDGFNGPLASMEGVFIALDTIPITIMSVILIAVHPGWWLTSVVDGGTELKRNMSLHLGGRKSFNWPGFQ